MDLPSAAKYMVVAWVKDWPLLTYLGAVAPGMIASQAHSEFPWLPADASWWKDENGECVTTRRFMQQAFPITNARLWEASGTAERLAVHVEISRLVCGQIVPAASTGAAKRYNHDALRDQTNLLDQMTREAFRRMNGRHWQVCK